MKNKKKPAKAGFFVAVNENLSIELVGSDSMSPLT